VVIAIAGMAYLFYYYIMGQVGVVVKFNSSTTEDVALQTLSKYKSGIESRFPKDYDYNLFNMFNGFKMNTIEFATCRYCAYVTKSHIAAEPGVQGVAIIEHLPTPQEDQKFYQYYLQHLAPQATTTTSTQ